MNEITGEQSSSISAFKLSATDTDTERRNFPGYATHTLAKDLMDEACEEGTTHTRGGK